MSKVLEQPIAEEASTSPCKLYRDNRKETGLMKQNENCEDLMVDLLQDDNVKLEVDNYFLNCSKTTSEDAIVSKEVQSNNYQAQKTSAVRSLDGSANKGGSANLLKRKGNTDDGNITTLDSNGISSDKNQMAIDNHAIVQYDSNGNDLKNVYAVLTSKEQEFSQAALKVVLSKRAKLCLELRDLEDQIVQCDKNIQILHGSEGDLALKMQLLGSLIQESVHQCSSKIIECKRSPDSIASNLCQELDDVCCRNNWTFPRYCLSARDGGFDANVTVKGTDFEYSACGELHSQPNEARESAAAQMLAKLSNSSGIV